MQSQGFRLLMKVTKSDMDFLPLYGLKGPGQEESWTKSLFEIKGEAAMD